MGERNENNERVCTMSEPIMTASAAIKGGAMLATGGLVADAVIFTDHTYIYLAIVGAIVSTFGVLHEVFGAHSKEYSAKEIVAEVIKGAALGLLAIPFWYLVITEGLLGNIVALNVGKVSNSLALIVSFALSWYTVPLFDWLSSFVRRKAR